MFNLNDKYILPIMTVFNKNYITYKYGITGFSKLKQWGKGL